MRRRASLILAAVAALGVVAAPDALAGKGREKPWPPARTAAKLFVHFGEEHINDADGPTLLPKVVRQSARYRPDLVTMSGDKVDDGEPEQLELWADVMRIYDRKGIPWFAAVGNHDRKKKPGSISGGDITADIGPYAEFFADRPYPMGDASGYPDPRIRPRKREADDPDGASSHYFVDYANVRWVFIDNSCWSIILCNAIQNPSGQNPRSQPQLDFLERVGRDAGERGKLVFVVMHMPTRDPGDQLYREPIAVQHTMGKTALGVLDNTTFERAAEDAGADAVFVAHIKGQFLYEGRGGIPYFIDGGAGGELYTTGPVGVDHGFWHGYRLVHVRGEGFRTEAVPIFVRDGIRIEGPRRVERGRTSTFEAFGRQPVFNDPAKVPALELRDPDPTPRSAGSAGSAWIGDAAKWGGPLVALLLVVALAAFSAGRRRPRLAAPALALVLGGAGFAGISAAQQSEPTSTPVEALPNPARIWTTSAPRVLRPVASESDDPRRDERTQTADGTFRGACPGRARLTITSGFESAREKVRVPSRKGRPIVRSIRPGARRLAAGERKALAHVRLAQRARVSAVVRRGGRRVARVRRSCSRRGRVAIRWDGERRRGRSVRPGRYRLVVRVLTDRPPVKRGFAMRVARR